MINPEVRHIIEPELAEGEELLWAEKTKVMSQQKFTKYYQDDTQMINWVLKFFLWIGLPVLVVSLILFPAFREVGMYMLFLLPICLLSLRHKGKHTVKTIENMDVGGYALTNFRLFELDKTLNITRRDDASKLRKVEETTCLVLRPVGNGMLKIRNLFFLNNNYATANYIRNLIKKSMEKD